MSKQKTKLQLQQELELAQKRIEELERKLPAPGENEERFSRFFQASPAQMAITDINTGKYLDINKTFLETLEFTREEVLGKTALELNLFFDPDQRGALLGKMKEQGFLRDEDVLIRTKSGGLRHGIFSAEYIQVNSQSFLLTVMNDITERKLAEERLSESETRLKGFLDSAPDAMVIVNAQGKIILANLQTEKLFGYKQNELLGMEIERLIPERSRNIHPKNRDNFLKNPQHKITGLNHEIYALRKDGSEFPVEISLSHHNMQNEMVILSAIRDITEKKQAEVSLLKSTQILHESQVMARLGSWTADLKTGIFESSSEDAQLIGWAPGGHSLNELMNIIHPDDREFVQVSWSAALQGGPFDIEYRIIAGDDIRWLRVKASIKFDDHGVPASAIGVTQDITERKQSAILQETVYHIANAAQTTESLQDFFKEIHHHISNVMAAGNFYIALYDEGENLLHFVYSMDEKDPIRAAMPPDKGLTSHVLRTGESLLYVSNQTDQQIEIMGTQPKVWLGVPLIARNKIIGVMAVQNYSDPHAYGIREQRILEFVSSQVATAIHLKKATDLLQKSQTSLEMALATANLGSWELDIKRGKGMVWSKEMFHLFRRDPARGIPELAEFMEMIHPDDRQRLLNAQEEAFRSGQVVTLEYRATPIPGETRHYKVTIQGILDSEGRTIYASGTVLDITEIRQAFEKIQESEEKYRLLFETMVQGVVFQDENGGIIHANPAAERILGLTLDQMQGRTSIDPRWKSIHEDGSDFPGDTHPAMVALKTGKPIHNVTMGVYNPAFDSYNWININATPRFNENSEKPHQVYATFEDITERKLAENSLLASEKKLKSLIASQTHFVIRINMEGKYVYWNPQFEKEFGWIHEPNGLLHADSTKTICEHHRKRVFDVVQQCVSQPGQVFSVEIDKPARNGGIRTTLWEFMCITDEHNQPSEIQCMGMEITDRKKAEEAMRESEAKYRLLAENISDVIWVLDVESSRFRYISPSVTSLRGYSVEEVMTEDMAATLAPASLEYLSQVTPERLAKFQQGVSESYTDEVEQTCKDGTTVWTEVISRYVIDPETNRLEVYGVSRNITERKKAEAAIHLIEKRNTALIEHAPDGIALVDADGMFLFASPSAYRMFGYDAAEIVGTQSREKVHPQDVSLLANLREKLLSNPNVPQTVEYRFMHKNGEYHWLESTYTNMFDEPSISGIVINFRDVTERKLSEQITRQQSEQIRLLYEASQQLNRTLNLQKIYQTICDFMVTTIPTSTMFISAFDRETQLITCRAYWIENKWLDVSNFPSIPLEEEGKGTQSLVIRTGKAMLLNDFQSYMKNTSTVYQVDSDTNEISSEDDETPEEEVTRSALIVPLKSDGIVRGIIQVSSYRQDAYTENQLKLLESLALHIASAEQNAILYNQMLKELNERKQAEDALRASNETSQAILNASTESVFLMDTSGNVIAANETTAARLGKQVSDLAGTNMYDLIPESVGASRKKQMEMVIEKRKPVIFEDERFGVWLENSIYPIIDGDGTIRRVAVYGRDITDRKKAEHALRESEGRAQAMLQAIPDLMFRLNREGVFLDYKADAKDLHEQTVSLIGTRNRDIAPVEFADLIDHYIAKTLESNQLQTFEYQLPVPGKGLRDYEARMTPSGTDEVLAIVRDITERKQVEQNLRETQSRVELALKGANAGMWDWNVQTGETIFNERWAEIIGYALEEIEPVSIQTWADFCHPDDLKLSGELLEKHFAGKTQFYECEVRMKHKNGSWVWVFDRGKVMEWDSEQRPLRMIGTHLDITERKQSEEALRAREELYRMISTINADYVFSEDVDMNGKASTKWVGGGFEAITGYTFEEYLQQGGWLSILHPEDREKDAADFAALKNNQKIVSNLRMIAKNGEIRWVQVHANPLWDSELQCLTGVYGAVQDITERKKAEDALHASEEKYRVLIESLDNMIASVDNDGRFLYVNDMAAAQMHLTPNELIGKTMYELFPPEVTARQMSDIQRVIHGDQGITFEAPSFSSTAPRWYRTSILPIHDEDGLVTQVLINSTDIHNLKTAQQELQDLNRTLEERVKQRTAEVQDLYDNSPIGYHSLDADGTLLFINQTHLTWLGYTREEMIGHSITEFLTTSGLERFTDIYPAFLKNGMVRDVESEFRRKDGSIVPVLISATAVYNEAGEFVMSRTSVFDNTGQKAAEQALRNANLELARAMRMKDEFLASMSHELRTPLTGILGLSEALQINVYGPINEKQQNTLANIEASGRHLLDLINDILDVSKIEAGKLELQMEACSLSEICQSSIQLTKGMAGKKRQTVNFTMNPANISVRGDARRLKQILVNLLSNSVKFTPEEGMLGLDVTANDSEGLVYISIWDKGIGITPEDLKKLFQPFVQLDSSLSRQQSGTGLGLALVQRLVELHGGSIDVQSVPGEGSRFTVTLPCQPADKASQEVENPSQLKFHQALIIEDTPADAEHLARYVKSLGITAIMHTSGKDAVERVIETQPDVVFLDLNLPEVSGWDVLTQIKNSRNTKHIPVVITSVDDDKSKASKLDADGYLVKFFTLSDLRTALSHIQKPSLASSEGHINPAAAAAATIMIVDDNEVNINTLADFLAMQNFNIISVKSGVDFLAQAPHIHPDIVLMDIQMPGMDGLETTRRLRRLSDRRLASVPVVAITALAMPGDRERCIEAGADEYITKPFRLTEIHDLILKMVEERKSLTGG